MKKRFLTILLVCFLVCTSLFAANKQKIYSVDDDIYSTIADLYLMTGHALPSSTGPWSAAELQLMMDKLSVDEIPQYLVADYYEVLDELNEFPKLQWKGIGATFSQEVNLQLAFHANDNSSVQRTDKNGFKDQLFIGRRNWASDYVKNLLPIYALDWETYVEDSFYADFLLGFYTGYSGRNDSVRNDFGTSNVSNNIPTLQNFKFEMGFIDGNFPFRGFFSAGSEHWNIDVGRDKLSWGVGKTGNLTISNNLPYHDFAKFAAFSDAYKYTFLASSFPYSGNYYSEGKYNYTGEQGGLDGLSLYIAHRIEGRFFKDILNVTLTEALMYESPTNHIDLLAMNPMYFFHNAYAPDNGNSTLALEFDVTPFRGFNAYGQIMVDDYSIAGEASASATSRGVPNRLAVLTGASYSFPLLEGLAKVNFEFAQTDPYMYLRNKVDYVVPIRYWNNIREKITWDEYFMGYTYGCDSRVFNLSLDYKKGPLSLSFGLLDVMQGTHDQWTVPGDSVEGKVGANGEAAYNADTDTCSTLEFYGSKRYDYVKNAVQNTFDLSLKASYEFLDGKITAYSQADLVFVTNGFNVKTQDDVDFQLVLGAKYAF